MKKYRKNSKILIALITISICGLVFSSNVFAALTDKLDPNESATGSFTNAMNILIGIFQVVAVGVASIMLIVLGIKYVSSAPNEKAEIKKHAVVYVVGACIVFGSAGLIGLFKSLVLESLTKK